MDYKYSNDPNQETFTDAQGRVWIRNGDGGERDTWEYSTDLTPDGMSRLYNTPGFTGRMTMADFYDAQAEKYALQQRIGGGANVGAMSPQELARLTGGIQSQDALNRTRDEQELTSLQKDFDAIPDNLRTLYSNAAKKAGTASGTAEFNAGLESEVQQGTRGAQAAMGGRLAALYQRLGRPMPTGLEQWKPGDAQATNKVDNAVDNTIGTVDADKGQATADTSATESPETSAPADSQNAITQASAPSGELTEAQKKKMLALQEYNK